MSESDKVKTMPEFSVPDRTQTLESQIAYIDELLATGDSATVRAGLINVVNARGGAGAVARDGGIGRYNLYQALKYRGDCSLTSFLRILGALGCTLRVTPERERAARYGQHLIDFAKRVGWDENDAEGAFEYVQRKSYAQGLEDAAKAGWKEAAIAWEVCASIHRTYGSGRDPLYSTRQGDFVSHAANARMKLNLPRE